MKQRNIDYKFGFIMKNFLILLVISLTGNLYSQSLNVFDIDTADFPVMKAKFYVFDANRNQLSNLSPSDIEILENSVRKNVKMITCPPPSPPLALSSVLVMDASGSMGGGNLKLAKEAATAWIDGLPLGQSECAITAFDTKNYMVRDFSTDRVLLLQKVKTLFAKGGTDYDAAMLNPLAGGLLVTKNAKYKRVIVFLSDGMPNRTPQVSKIIAEANSQDVTVYTVTLNMKCPQSLKDIATQTGGQWFENVTTEAQARSIYSNILQTAQGGIPCEIEWETNVKCTPDLRNVEIRMNSLSLITQFIYSQPVNILAQLEFDPQFVYFLNKTPGIKHDTVISVTALFSDFNINSITSSNPSLQISPDNFSLKAGENIDLTLSFTPNDSAYTYAQFEFENEHCPIQYFSYGGYKNVRPNTQTLKLTHPNGGEVFIVGSDTNITWEGLPPNEVVKLEYSFDKGKTWNVLNNTAKDLEYIWKNLPKPASNKCLVKVKQLEKGQEIDTSSRIEWQRNFGGSGTDAAWSVYQSNDGTILTAGWTGSNDGDITSNKGIADYMILKTDEDGNFRMIKTLGGSKEDHATAVMQTYDNGIIVAGYAYSSDGDVIGNKGDADFWVVKIGEDYNIKWNKTFGGSLRDFASSIIQTRDSGFVVAGYTYSVDGDVTGNRGSGDAWVVKMDRNGSLQWQKTLGGGDYDIANSIQQTMDGGFILAGETWSTDGDSKGNHGNSDYFVIKLSSDGSVVWSKTYGGSATDAAWSVRETLDGAYVVAGESWSTNGDVSENKGSGDFWILKLGAIGNIIWEKSLGGSNYDVAYAINETWDSGFIVGGSTESNDGDVTDYLGNIDCWAVKVSSTGDLQWQKALGGSQAEVAYSVDQALDGGYIMAGYSLSTNGDITGNKGGSDVWLVKLPSVETVIQEDVSDNVFSIVEAIPASHDIDMGDVITGDIKDSVVTDFVKNVGSWKFTVDSIYFSGADASAFSLVSGFPQYEIVPNGIHSAEIRFKPAELKKYQAKIIILTQSDTLQQNISGQGIQQKIKILSDIIDFGKVYIGHSKDSIVTAIIENTSSAQVNITKVNNDGPDNKQFTIIDGGNAFSLMPGDKKEMKLRFSALEEGRTSGGISFDYEGTGSPALVQLFAEAYKIVPLVTTNSPICTGQDLLIYSDPIPGAVYHWSGPNGFSSNLQNIIIKNVVASDAGVYKVYATIGEISSDTTIVNVEVSTMLIAPGDSSFIFVQSATREEDFIKLNKSKVWDGGSIWLKNRFTIKEDFATTFQFKTRFGNNNGSKESSDPGADGISFVFQNHIYPVLGDKGGAMGYQGITNSLAIEFDLYHNEYDPNGNHIAVQSMGSAGNTPDHRISGSNLGMADDIIEIKRDILYFVKIEYEWNNQELKIFLDTTGDYSEPALIIKDLDVPSYLNLESEEYVYLGITSASGLAYQEHDIYNWVVPCNNQLISVENENSIIKGNYLSVFPNPANDKINVKMNLIEPGMTKLYIINSLGNKSVLIFDKTVKNPGEYSFEVETESLSSGIYFVVLETTKLRLVEKVVMTK